MKIKLSDIKKLEEIERLHSLVSKIHLETYNDRIITRSHEGEEKTFRPHKSYYELRNTKKSTKGVVGPYGSGKSSGVCNYILESAQGMPKCFDGIRRYKIVIVRNTYQELYSTTYQTWKEWTHLLPCISDTKKPFETINRFSDKDGVIELWAVFLALDREPDVRKLKSMEATDAWINEAAELLKLIVEHVESRVGRYPAKENFKYLWNKKKPYKDWDAYKPMVIFDTNPPPDDHWLPQREESDDEDFFLYHQPPGLIEIEKGKYVRNPDAENIENLQSDYYLRMVSKGESFVRVFAMGKYGLKRDGQVVFPSYNDDLHSSDTIDFTPDCPLLLGIDYGTVSPAVLILQDVEGQVRAIKEFCCSFMTIKQLFADVVLPWIETNLKGYAFEATDDPANTEHGREALKELGVYPTPARTNKISLRIDAVNDRLNGLVMGKPKLLVSRKGCPNLRKGFMSQYVYKRLRVIGGKVYADVPDKTHPHSDIHDCLQYGCLFSKKELNLEESSKLSKMFANTERF